MCKLSVPGHPASSKDSETSPWQENLCNLPCSRKSEQFIIHGIPSKQDVPSKANKEILLSYRTALVQNITPCNKPLETSQVSKACPSIFNFFTLCSLSQVEQYVNYLMKHYNYSNSSALTYNYGIHTLFHMPQSIPITLS